MQDALRALVVLQARAAAQLLQSVAAICAEPHDLLDVVPGSCRRAFAHELQTPEPLPHVGADAEQERRVFFAEPLQHFERCARVGPRLGVAHRDLAAVGEAGFCGGIGLAIYDSDVVTELRKVIRGADTEQPATEDEYMHLNAFEE